MKIKKANYEATRRLLKTLFEVVDGTDEVSNHSYGKATLTWFEFDFRRVLFFSTSIYSLLSIFIIFSQKKAIVSFTIASFIIEPIRHYN